MMPEQQPCILIVEDEPLIALDLELLLRDMGYARVCQAPGYEEALQVMEQQEVDLALLDIHLKGGRTGIELASWIAAHRKFPYLFLSSYEDIAMVKAALDTRPATYLQKPFQKASIYSAIQLALQSRTPPVHAPLIVRHRDLVKKVYPEDIICLKSAGNYVEIITADNRYLERLTMKAAAAQLPSFFCRTHKSWIINVQKLEAVNHEYVLVGGLQVPLAASYRSEVLRRFATTAS